MKSEREREREREKGEIKDSIKSDEFQLLHVCDVTAVTMQTLEQ